MSSISTEHEEYYDCRQKGYFSKCCDNRENYPRNDRGYDKVYVPEHSIYCPCEGNFSKCCDNPENYDSDASACGRTIIYPRSEEQAELNHEDEYFGKQKKICDSNGYRPVSQCSDSDDETLELKTDNYSWYNCGLCRLIYTYLCRGEIPTRTT